MNDTPYLFQLEVHINGRMVQIMRCPIESLSRINGGCQISAMRIGDEYVDIGVRALDPVATRGTGPEGT